LMSGSRALRVWCARINEVPIAVRLALPGSIGSIVPQRGG
jgi:hypothetical protein